MQQIGLIHHLSSTGGTLISKCIAAMPGVVLLSEMHPLVGLLQPQFFPLDPLAQLLVNYPALTPDDEVLEREFCNRFEIVAKTCADAGKKLILRDHSHSDYLTDRQPSGRLVNALEKSYKLLRVVTVRHPVDAWLSMRSSGFDAHLRNFTGYCDRVLRFLDDHAELPYWRYEDFVADPATIVAQISAHLQIPYDPEFLSTFGDIVLTGDSGRKPEKIIKLPRRNYSPEFADEVAAAKSLEVICARFGYSTTLDDTARSRVGIARFF
jgi:hypothetical protein